VQKSHTHTHTHCLHTLCPEKHHYYPYGKAGVLVISCQLTRHKKRVITCNDEYSRASTLRTNWYREFRLTRLFRRSNMDQNIIIKYCIWLRKWFLNANQQMMKQRCLLHLFWTYLIVAHGFNSTATYLHKERKNRHKFLRGRNKQCEIGKAYFLKWSWIQYCNQ